MTCAVEIKPTMAIFKKAQRKVTTTKTSSTKKAPTKRAVKKAVTKSAVPDTVVALEPTVPDSPTMGRYFPFTIQHGQNRMFADNGPGGMELTDKQLTCLWTVNWSQRKQYREDQIPGARRDYNKGKHGTESRSGLSPRVGKWTVDTETNVRTYHEPR